jgi:hypothetical protein
MEFFGGSTVEMSGVFTVPENTIDFIFFNSFEDNGDGRVYFATQ